MKPPVLAPRVPALLAAFGLLAMPAAAARKRVAHPAHAAARPAPARAAEGPLPGPPFPAFEHGPQVASACTVGLEGATLRAAQLEKRKPGPDWLKGWEDLYDW